MKKTRNDKQTDERNNKPRRRDESQEVQTARGSTGEEGRGLWRGKSKRGETEVMREQKEEVKSER